MSPREQTLPFPGAGVARSRPGSGQGRLLPRPLRAGRKQPLLFCFHLSPALRKPGAARSGQRRQLSRASGPDSSARLRPPEQLRGGRRPRGRREAALHGAGSESTYRSAELSYCRRLYNGERPYITHTASSCQKTGGRPLAFVKSHQGWAAARPGAGESRGRRWSGCSGPGNTEQPWGPPDQLRSCPRGCLHVASGQSPPPLAQPLPS